MSKPLILIDPLPRTLDLICDAPTRARLEALGELVIHEASPMPNEIVERHLPEAEIIIGQTKLACLIFCTKRYETLLHV